MDPTSKSAIELTISAIGLFLIGLGLLRPALLALTAERREDLRKINGSALSGSISGAVCGAITLTAVPLRRYIAAALNTSDVSHSIARYRLLAAGAGAAASAVFAASFLVLISSGGAGSVVLLCGAILMRISRPGLTHLAQAVAGFGLFWIGAQWMVTGLQVLPLLSWPSYEWVFSGALLAVLGRSRLPAFALLIAGVMAGAVPVDQAIWAVCGIELGLIFWLIRHAVRGNDTWASINRLAIWQQGFVGLCLALIAVIGVVTNTLGLLAVYGGVQLLSVLVLGPALRWQEFGTDGGDGAVSKDLAATPQAALTVTASDIQRILADLFAEIASGLGVNEYQISPDRLDQLTVDIGHLNTLVRAVPVPANSDEQDWQMRQVMALFRMRALLDLAKQHDRIEMARADPELRVHSRRLARVIHEFPERGGISFFIDQCSLLKQELAHFQTRHHRGVIKTHHAQANHVTLHRQLDAAHWLRDCSDIAFKAAYLLRPPGADRVLAAPGEIKELV